MRGASIFFSEGSIFLKMSIDQRGDSHIGENQENRHVLVLSATGQIQLLNYAGLRMSLKPNFKLFSGQLLKNEDQNFICDQFSSLKTA